MADEKKLRFGVDSSAYDEYINRVKKSSSSLMSEMVRDVQSYSASSKEALNIIENQIKALEKRRQFQREINKEENEALQQKLRASGGITEQEYKSGVRGISQQFQREKRYDKEIVEELKAVKSQLVSILREGKLSREEQKALNTYLKTGGEGMSEEEIQRAQTAQQAQMLLSGGAGGRTMRGGKFSPQAALGVLESQDIVDATSTSIMAGGGMLKGLGKGGIIGLIISATIGKVLQGMKQNAQEIESTAGDFAVLTGQGMGGIYNTMRGLDKERLARMGLTFPEYMQGASQLLSGAKTTGLGEDIGNLLALERGTPLGMQEISTLAGFRRFGGGGVTQTERYFEKYLQKTGQDISALPEIIGTFTSEMQNMMMQTGRVDTENIANVIARIGMQTGFQGDVLGSSVGNIRRGMSMQQSPALRGLQMRSARMAAGGNLSLWEMEKMMANPFDNPEYMATYLDNLRTVTGGGDRFYRTISRSFGVAPEIAEKIGGLDLRSEVDKEMLGQLKKDYISNEAKAAAVVGEVELSQKTLKNVKQQFSFKAIEEPLGGINEKVLKIVQWLEKKEKTDIEREKIKEEKGVLRSKLAGMGYYSAGITGID